MLQLGLFYLVHVRTLVQSSRGVNILMRNQPTRNLHNLRHAYFEPKISNIWSMLYLAIDFTNFGEKLQSIENNFNI